MGTKSKADMPQCRVVVHEDAVIQAISGNGKLTPLAIHLHGTHYPIGGIVRRWTGKHRGARLFFFNVEAAGRRFKMCFNAGEVWWMVEELVTNDG
ncbi:MAG: hypothetical protein ACYDBB_26100 [Armatimonadota bacterium]